MEDPIVRRNRLALGLGLSAFVIFASGSASASVLSATTRLSSCDDGALKNCVDTMYRSTTLANEYSAFIGSPVVNGAVATFATAFAAWDKANGSDWTLKYGGALGVSISATIGLSASNDSGGLSPVIFTLSGGTPSLLSQLVWTQALVISYTPLQGALSKPVQTLDTFSLSQDAAGDNPYFPNSCVAASSGASPAGGAFCGPIYPFQYGSTLSNRLLDGVRLGVDPFYDAPRGGWPNASFEAITLLSEVDARTDTLTVFQGVEYGFSLRAAASGFSRSQGRLADPVPEPSTWALALCGFAALGFAGWRRRKAA